MTQEDRQLDRAWKELQAAKGMYEAMGFYSQLIRVEQAEARYLKLAEIVHLPRFKRANALASV